MDKNLHEIELYMMEEWYRYSSKGDEEVTSQKYDCELSLCLWNVGGVGYLFDHP